MSVDVDTALPSIDIVGASAGTGKTTRLASEFIKAVQGEQGVAPIDPTRILVCTFTNKAADELTARIRKGLLKIGNSDAAQLVIASYVGTVNGICGRLLKDYAIEGGLSPEQNVIPEHMQKALFEIASSDVLDAYAMRMDDVADRLSFDYGRKTRFGKSVHWVQHVIEICGLARANALDAKSLKESASLSWGGLKVHLATRDDSIDEDAVHQQLSAALDTAVHSLERTNDSTETTAKALEVLTECMWRARHEPLRWRDWAALSKIKTSTQSKQIVAEVLEITKLLPHHPRLHDDLRDYIEGVFDCASECLIAYQDYKAANGLVDFIDQEYLALSLLDVPAVQDSLRSRLELALIDEFQDTSPIQLALFLKIAKIMNHSIWVGDVKQAIYGFRGTDPGLMKTASELFNRQSPLGESYRSRPELVSFSNEVFKRVFPNFGITEEDVVIRPSGKRVASERHSIEVWKCKGVNLSDCFNSLANAVSELLLDPGATIEDPHTGGSRKIRGSDIAVLARKNDHCSQIAGALADAGFQVAMSRAGLLDTPECLLAVSALRYLLDKTDKVALGRIVHLMQNYETAKAEDWLEKWLKNSRSPEKLLPHLAGFESLRGQLGTLTASDALGLAVSAGKVMDMIHGWGNVSQRMSNLDALRGLVSEYEDACAMARLAATARGFIIYLEQLEDSDQPPSANVDAVQVLTYHGSKGLEWPIVILADLDAGCAPKVHKDLCRVHVESKGASFDINKPLQNRWIRFWPWAFGSIEKDGFFEIQASTSAEFSATQFRLLAENTRLMYVGITRARDVLILAPYVGRKQNPTGQQWLDELTFDGGKPAIEIPEDGDLAIIRVGESAHRSYLREFEGCAAKRERTVSVDVCAPKYPDFNLIQRAPYSVTPSSLSTPTELDSTLIKVTRIGERFGLAGTPDMNMLGEAVHGILAVDDVNHESEVRISRAQRLLHSWRITQLEPAHLLEMSQRLKQFLATEFDSGEFLSECPVVTKIGSQRLRGTIDLLIETEDAFHIVDHKTFPGSADKWTEKATSFLPQLEAYAAAVTQASGKPVGRLMIHMPVVGVIIDLPRSIF